MNSDKKLFMLFKFDQRPPQSLNEESANSCYKVMKIFSVKGNIDSKLLIKWGLSPIEELKFTTKEALSQFGLEAVASSHSDGIFILSSNDFNIGLESSNSLEDFSNIFQKYGTYFELEEKSRRFFGKLF